MPTRRELVPIGGLWHLAATLGLRSIGRDPASTWDLLVRPIDFLRCIEYPTVFKQVDLKAGSRICDVSSPKLPAVYLARRYDVTAGDVYAEDVDLWRMRVRGRSASPHFQVFDATALPFPDGSFDLTYSVSVLEHIEGEGDRKAIDEMVRVTKPGGYVAFNVSYKPRRRENYVERDVYGKKYTGTPLFFSRHYDAEWLRERLVHPGVTWNDPLYIYERSSISRVVLGVPRPPRWAITATAPLWAKLMYGATTDITATSRTGRALLEVSLVGRKSERGQQASQDESRCG
jgi:SAM-dependent methyltransferase